MESKMLINTQDKLANYSFEKEIGGGTFGEVFRVKILDKGGKEAAMKIIDYEGRNYGKNLIAREIEVLKRSDSPYMVKYIDDFQVGNVFYIVMEYAEGLSLEKRIKNKLFLEKDDAKLFIKQIAKAFLDINKNSLSFIHRDIKPANLIQVNDSIKIVDFGLSKPIEGEEKEKKSDHTKNRGSFIYMSPQMLAGEKYSAKTDVWSTGITFYELLHKGKFPWTADDPVELNQNIRNQKLALKKEIMEDDFFSLLFFQMLTVDEDKRISWQGIYDHYALDDVSLE